MTLQAVSIVSVTTYQTISIVSAVSTYQAVCTVSRVANQTVIMAIDQPVSIVSSLTQPVNSNNSNNRECCVRL